MATAPLSRVTAAGRRLAPGWVRGRMPRWIRGLAKRLRPTTTAPALYPLWADITAAVLVDAPWYRSRYPAVADAGDDPTVHYATVGWRSGFDPNPMFDTAWYLSTYPDVARLDANPLLHYFEHGAAEGRNPGPNFDTTWYLARNPDLRQSDFNPLAHYLRYGLAEGREPLPRHEPNRGSTHTIVLVSGEANTPGHRYRVERLARAMRRLGHHVRELEVPDAAGTRLADLDRASLVVLWRTAWGPEVEQIIRRARSTGAIVAFDVDDLMVDPDVAVVGTIDGIRSQGLTEDEAQDWFAKMRLTAQAADVCLCTTEALGDQLRRLGAPVFVLPNGFDDESLVISRLARRVSNATPHDGLVRIGYCSGSLTHQADFAIVAPAVALTLRAHPECRLVVFRMALDLDEFPEFDDLRDQVEWRDIVPLASLANELARFDINLAPLEVGNPFCEAKSNLKFFEAALVDVPTVASPTDEFRSVIDAGDNGLLALDTDEWQTALESLVTDPERRARLGAAAFRSVQWPLGELHRTREVATLLDQTLGDRITATSAFELARRRAAAEVDIKSADPPTVAFTTTFESDRLRPSRVTVVVPVHDYAHLVVEALDSVRDQTMADLDLIVVDDASSDDSLEVVRRWLDEHSSRFHRMLLVSHSTNGGVACARNLGFELADTPWVLPLDADNQLLPTCCDRLLDAIESTGAAFAYPRLLHFGESSELLTTDQVRNHLPYSAQRLVVSNYIDALTLVRTDAWRAAGGYRLGLLGWEDYDMWCRLAELGLAGIEVTEDLARYRVHETSMLHSVTRHHDEAVRAAITEQHPWLRLDDPNAPSIEPARVVDVPRPKEPALIAEAVAPLEREVDDETGDAIDLRHVGNPLPERALALAAQCAGPILHLSGGGTRLPGDRVIHLDAHRYGPTDVIADAHRLPFADASFDLVIAMNAFEHYRDPAAAAAEIERVLRLGGLVLIHTAFLQPVHEEPHHYFNCTRFGLREWFEPFDEVDLTVSDNFHAGYTLSWLASEAEAALESSLGSDAARRFRDLPMGRVADYWRDPATRDDGFDRFARLRGDDRDRLAAGFEYLGRRQP